MQFLSPQLTKRLALAGHNMQLIANNLQDRDTGQAHLFRVRQPKDFIVLVVAIGVHFINDKTYLFFLSLWNSGTGSVLTIPFWSILDFFDQEISDIWCTILKTVNTNLFWMLLSAPSFFIEIGWSLLFYFSSFIIFCLAFIWSMRHLRDLLNPEVLGPLIMYIQIKDHNCNLSP